MVKFFRHYISITQILRVTVEFSLFFISIPIGLSLANSFNLNMANVLLVGLLYACTGIIIMSSSGLYNRHLRDSLKSTLVRCFSTFLIAVVVMSTIFYSWPEMTVSRKALSYAISFSFVSLLVVRLIFSQLNKYDKFYRKKIVVYGVGTRASLIGTLRRKNDTRNYNCIAYFATNKEKIVVKADNVIDMPDNLLDYVKENNIDEIIVALDDKRKALRTEELLECRVYGINVIELSTFLEKHTGRIRLQSVDPSSLIFSTGFVRNTIYERTKRGFDLSCCTLLFLLSWPIMLLTAIAIMLESGFKGSILYKQVRVGQHNKNFKVIKFRSMGMGAEKGGAQWAQKNDNRVTKVGKFIRKARIDELPQLFNVFVGEMSFVGPRPERPEFVSDFSKSIDFYKIRHFVKPGITGWAQVGYPYGATVEDTKNKLEFDLYYLKNYSFFLDSMIIINTIHVVLGGQGGR